MEVYYNKNTTHPIGNQQDTESFCSIIHDHTQIYHLILLTENADLLTLEHQLICLNEMGYLS